MPALFSNAHIELVLNGHRVLGYADEERPVEFPTAVDMAELSFGPDGGLYGKSMAQLGGDVTIRVTPNSPTAQWLVRQKMAWKESLKSGSPVTIYSGSFSDASQGRSAQLEGGILRQCPDLPESGVTFEAIFTFEEITANVDGATFVGPLSG